MYSIYNVCWPVNCNKESMKIESSYYPIELGSIFYLNAA